MEFPLESDVFAADTAGSMRHGKIKFWEKLFYTFANLLFEKLEGFTCLQATFVKKLLIF